MNRFKILEIDPWLEPYAADISLRMDHHSQVKKNLLQKKRLIKSFANGHLHYGFHPTPKGWIYREWAPAAEALSLIGDFNNWDDSKHPLTRTENGDWEIELSEKSGLKHLSKVKVRIWSGGKSQDRIPLYIKRTIQDPITHDFCGQVWHPKQNFKWTDKAFSISSTTPVYIYEAHVGMAQEKEDIGTFKEFTEHMLPRIKANGYNTVQLMAIMHHPYYASFGYHVSNFFAVASWFGTPDDFKELIDTAHSMGIAVLMDIVHSHAVKNISEGINGFDGTVYQFFHEGPKGEHPAWDSKLFNYNNPSVQHFLLSNIKYWMEEYHLDGFRFDGVTSMIYHDHGLGCHFDSYDKYFDINTDIDAVAYLQLANELIKEIRPDSISVAEDMSGLPGMAIPVEEGGLGFDYRLAMGMPDFWVKMMKTQDEAWSMQRMWHELTTHRPQEKRIGYAESHDQALVGDKTLMFWLADKEMYWSMAKGQKSIIIDRAIALHKMIRFITLCLGSEGYLNFMGNEFGHPEWIDFPREGNNWSFKHCKRQWSLADNDLLKYKELYLFDKDMLHFVEETNILSAHNLESYWIDEHQKIIAFKKAQFIFLFNFNPTESFERFPLPTHSHGTFKVVFSSDCPEYGGHNRICTETIYHAQPLPERDHSTGIYIYAPNRSALVLKKTDPSQ